MSPRKSAFSLGKDASWASATDGVRSQVLSHADDLMVVRVDFDQGAAGTIHHHPHRQVSYVVTGRFEATVGNEHRVLTQGDSFFAAENVPHGVRAITAGTLIDAFTPARDSLSASDRV